MLQAAAVDGDRLERMLARRVVGEPLEQVLGWAEFCGLRIAVAPGVFVPRRRTEILVERAAQLLGRRRAPCRRRPLLRDRGHRGRDRRSDSSVELHAADLDPDAVACARQNVTMGEVHEGDLYDALPVGLRGRVDLLAVNAPYVPTDEIPLMPPEARLHEHHVALDGGADGLDLHRRVAAGAPDWLRPGGTLLIETSRHRRRPRPPRAPRPGSGRESSAGTSPRWWTVALPSHRAPDHRFRSVAPNLAQ